MAIVYALRGGSWADPTLWSTGALPQPGDEVYADGHLIEIFSSDLPGVPLKFLTTKLRPGGSPMRAGGIFRIRTTNVTITGDVIAGSRQAMDYFGPNNGTLKIVGNIYGGDGGQNSNAFGFYTTAAIPMTLIVDGSAIGGVTFPAIWVDKSDIDFNVFVRTAVGNGAGLNSNGALTDPATRQTYGIVNATTTAQVFVENFICGSRGQFPVAGNVYFKNFDQEEPENFIQFRDNKFKPVTLSTPTGFLNFVPEERDVRLNTPFGGPLGFNEYTGTLSIPNTAQVIFGVPVDNMTGVGFIDITEVWGVPVSGLRVPGSMGERLRNSVTINGLSGIITTLNI